jgi:hypothetical protein
MKKLVFWEMNEINFEFVSYYIRQGKLNNFKSFIEKHGQYTTFAEKKYEELEPWIQWPTVRTGLDYKDHKVFRLGDMVESSIKQHWEILEDRGLTVAAVSPINGVNNTRNSPFWIPDPWVNTRVSGDGFAYRITKAIKQAVNDNSEEKLGFATALAIVEGLLTKTQLSSWKTYLKGIVGSLKKQHWSKAIVLDRLLADIFIALWNKHQPDFSVLFLNSGAHIQHHYMCSSPAYTGNAKNPSWYVPKGADPLLEILELYDSILGELDNLPNTRLMVSVGLQQVPYEKITYYWRLKDHGQFLKNIGIDHTSIQPRMTRDFLVEFESPEAAAIAVLKLKQVMSRDGVQMFGEVENRGKDIFVTLTYPDVIGDNFSINVDGKEYANFEKDVVFVAIKNGQHDTVGCFMDNQLKPGDLEQHFALKNIFGMVMQHFGVKMKNSLAAT